MNKVSVSIVVLFLLLAGLGSFQVYSYFNRPKTAYIIIKDVYDAFTLKKELEKKFTGIRDAREKILDSLAVTVKLIAKQIDNEKGKDKGHIELYNLKREDFFKKKKAMGEDNDQLTKQYDQEIVTQLNQYVKDYGAENGYIYIYGSDGNGSLMYAREEANISKQVIAYINRKYRGEK